MRIDRGLTLGVLLITSGLAFAAPPEPAKDPLTPEMRKVLNECNEVHAGKGQKAVDDAVEALHAVVAKSDLKTFGPLAVGHLMRLALRDTQTRLLLRKALADGWLDEFQARAFLVEAGDTPGPHVKALAAALDGADAKARRAALKAVGGLGKAGKELVPKLRKIVDDPKADPADFRRAYRATDEVPDHVLAHWALTHIQAADNPRP